MSSTHRQPPQPHNEVTVTHLSELLPRLVWIFLGPMALMLLLYGIAHVGSGWLTFFDVTFFVVLLVTIGCRWLEQRSRHPATATGEPSTWENFRHYSWATLFLAGTGWVLANVLGNHWFTLPID